jgi:hypothetical protein
MPTIPAEINWDALSPMGAWRVVHLALPISCGLSRPEVAAQTGESVKWVTRQLDLLRAELKRLG